MERYQLQRPLDERAQAPLKIAWAVLDERTQRLNIVDGSRVHPDYLDGMDCLGESPLESFEAQLAGAEARLLRAYLAKAGQRCARVFAFRALVRHHLRRGRPHHAHHEVWLMALLLCDGGALLAPVRRDSDAGGLAVEMDRAASTAAAIAAAASPARRPPPAPPPPPPPPPPSEPCEVRVADPTEFPSHLFACASLTALSLEGTKLAALDPAVCALTQLTRLELHCNRLATLPPALTALSALERLTLHSNALRHLPPPVFALTRLTWLSANSNRLEALPHDVSRLTALERLSLHANRLETVPGGLGACGRLKALSLFDNHLLALPPGVLGRLRECATFSVARNKLQLLPDDLAGMAALKHFWAHDNQLLALPSLTALTALEKVWLDVNPALSGPLDLRRCARLVEHHADCEVLLPPHLAAPPPPPPARAFPGALEKVAVPVVTAPSALRGGKAAEAAPFV